MSAFDDAYKQWLIAKIQSGQFDYTYGPGSPGATPSDMRQVTGARDNRLSTGDIALPPRDYAMFTPEERTKYRIADTSWFTPGKPTPTGSVERYYGATENQVAPTPSGQFPSQSPPPARTAGPMQSSWGDYVTALTTPTPTEKAASAIGSGLQSAAQQMINRSQTSSNQALGMLHPSTAAAILKQLATNNPYLSQYYNTNYLGG